MNSIKALKSWYYNLVNYNKDVKELVWANVFHDYVRGIYYLNDISLSPGRWSGNYSFLFAVCKILREFKPKGVLELGLGESSFLVNNILSNEMPDIHHTVLENNQEWIDHYTKNHEFDSISIIKKVTLKSIRLQDLDVNIYDLDENELINEHEFIIIDAPVGTPRYSRYNIYLLADKLKVGSNFILLFDDVHRNGEKETLSAVEGMLREKGIVFYRQILEGSKSQAIIASQKYKFAASL